MSTRVRLLLSDQGIPRECVLEVDGKVVGQIPVFGFSLDVDSEGHSTATLTLSGTNVRVVYEEPSFGDEVAPPAVPMRGLRSPIDVE